MNAVSPTTDPARVARLADDLAQGRTDTLGALFAAHDAPTPTIVWKPGLIDAQHPILRSFLRGCGGAPDGTLPVAWLDSEEFSALADWAMVVVPIEGEDDLIYRHYGSKIAEVYQSDMTGRRVSSIGGHVAEFFQALYAAVGRRREPVMSQHEPPRQVFVRAWRRIILPLINDAGDVACFAAVNVPDNDLRAGLEVLPDAVMVVTEGGDVCYANRAACLLFGQSRSPLAGMDLRRFTGLDIDLPESPEQLVLEGRVRTLREVTIQGSVIVPVHLTLAATFYRDIPLYVISARRATD
jgi:PAS domain S-box-containing protein